MKLTAIAGVKSFAHLLGLSVGAKAEEEETEDEKAKRAEEEKKEEDARRAEEEREREEGSADDGDGTDMADPDEDGGEDDVVGEGDEPEEEAESDEDKDKAKKAAFRSGRKLERTRCARIFSSPHAVGRPDLAAHLAFNTGMSSAAAIGTLKAAGVAGAARPTLGQRMQSVQPPNPGGTGGSSAGGAVDENKAFAARVAAAAKKARGEN